jgi:aryl-alcohol dehydrogenase-like predicted oxidoreductase
MRYRTFGALGWQVSEVGFGGWALGGGAWGEQDDGESIRALRRALDLGVNLIDTAAGYGNGRSERVIAQALAEHRGPAYLVSKTPPAVGPWPPRPNDRWQERYPEAYLRQNVEERLRNLRVEALDVLLLHIWNRAWNRDPGPLEFLRKLKAEGKIRAFGISTPDFDQDQVNSLLVGRQIDVAQLVYNVFEQMPRAETLPLARDNGVAVIGRLVFDEGSLTGKFTAETAFPEGDFRRNYFRGDRLAETVRRVERVRGELATTGYDLPTAAIRFALAEAGMSSVIPGMRNVRQVEANVAASDAADLPATLLERLYEHWWNRGNWHAGA